MSKFKKGDKIKRIGKSTSGIIHGNTYTFEKYDFSAVVVSELPRETWNQECFELINETNLGLMTNIITKAKELFLKEPQKTFRKAGLYNTNDMPTDDAVKIYVGYLMEKDQTFKTEIADKLVEVKE